MARPTRLTKKVREDIYKGIRLGLTYDRAAQLAGISLRTFYYWKQKGAQGKTPLYMQFLQALKKAEVEGEAIAIQQIRQAASDGTWTAAAWLLERRYPDRYGRYRVELTGKDGGPIEINHTAAARDAIIGRLLHETPAQITDKTHQGNDG